MKKRFTNLLQPRKKEYFGEFIEKQKLKSEEV